MSNKYTRCRVAHEQTIDEWWDSANTGAGPPALALIGSSGIGKLDTAQSWLQKRRDAGIVSVADGGLLTSGYFGGFEGLVAHAIQDAEANDLDIIAHAEQSLKRLFPHLPCSGYRVPGDLTVSATRAERTRFYHHEYQHKLLNGVYEFLVEYVKALDRRHVLVIDNAHAVSPTVRSFLRLIVRRRDLLERLRIILLSDEDRLDVAVAPACHVVRFGPMNLDEAESLARTWPSGDDVSSKQLEERWLLSGGNPAALGALFECAGAGVDAASTLSFHSHLDFYLAAKGDRFRSELLDRYIEGHCVSDDPIAVRNHHTYPPSARAARHRRVIDQLAQSGEEHLHLVHHLALAQPTDELQALATPTTALQELGLYDTWFEIVSPYFGSKELRALPDGEAPHNVAFLRMAFVLYSLGLAPVAVPCLDLFYTAFPDSRLTPTALYAQSMAYGRYQVPVDLPTAERYALRNLEQIDSVFADHPMHAYMKVFAENALAYIRARQGRLDEALELCTRGLDKMGEIYGDGKFALHQSILVYNTGQVHELLGDFERAVASYSRAISMDPYYGEYHNDLANLLQRHGHLTEALDHYAQAIALCPPYYEAHLNRAHVYEALGVLEAAEVDYLRVIELKPDEARAYCGLGTLVLQQGAYERAVTLFDEAVHHVPGDAHAYTNRAIARHALRDSIGALADLDLAIQQSPRLAEAWNIRGVVKADLGDVPGALEDLDRALALVDDADYRDNRAEIVALSESCG